MLIIHFRFSSRYVCSTCSFFIGCSAVVRASEWSMLSTLLSPSMCIAPNLLDFGSNICTLSSQCVSPDGMTSLDTCIVHAKFVLAYLQKVLSLLSIWAAIPIRCFTSSSGFRVLVIASSWYVTVSTPSIFVPSLHFNCGLPVFMVFMSMR